jgi:ATP-dependent Clp protease ATP-binding subunit ClpA
LENEIIPIELASHVFFTYPALVEIAEGATRYFPDAMMPDKAIDLALEIAPKLREKKGNALFKKMMSLSLSKRKQVFLSVKSEAMSVINFSVLNKF